MTEQAKYWLARRGMVEAVREIGAAAVRAFIADCWGEDEAARAMLDFAEQVQLGEDMRTNGRRHSRTRATL